MNHLSKLTKEEVRFICSIVPYQDTVRYFKSNPKEFHKIRPGFRVKAVSKTDATKLLVGNISKHFISDFIEKHISLWLTQIEENCSERLSTGDSRDLALLHTLPFSFFAENVSLYFKLVNEEYPEEYIALISAAVKSIKEANTEQDRINQELNSRDEIITKLNAESITRNNELDKAKYKLRSFNNKISELEKLQLDVQKDKEIIGSLQTKNQQLLDNIEKLRSELAEVKSNSLLLEEQIKAKLIKEQNSVEEARVSAQTPKCPEDLDEFKDYLGYNLDNIGMPNNAEYFPLLISHLSKILFQGIPIVINRTTGINVIKCVANTIIGQPTVKTLTFNQSTTVENISQFLSLPDRVLCLYNFIGNFNETELLPIIDEHRNKIIFLTVAYDRTIHYISMEFLRYIHYLNVNRISSLSVNTVLTEDPSTIAEVDCKPQWASTGYRYSIILREIMRELGFRQSLIEQKCAAIFDEQDLCRLLAFDILPYCADVLQISPYNTSERLLKYVGKCPYKKLFKEWFAL